MSKSSWTLNFDRMITSHTGKEIPDTNLAVILADQLAGAAMDRNIIKLFDWARTLHRRQPLTVDNEDWELLKEFVTTHKNLPVVTKANLLQVLLDSKNDAERADQT